MTEESVVSNFVTAVINKINGLITSHNTNPNAHSTKAHISYGQVDSTSTSTAFTATVSGITTLTDGTSVMLRNGRVTSAAGFTLNVNGLGAKPVYSSMSDVTAETTIFNINYTMLFVYDSTRISGGCWICYRGYNSDNNTIGYQIRTNSTSFTPLDKTYRYRIMLEVENNKLMPVNTSTSTSATASKTSTMNTREFKLGGNIYYYSYSSTINANAYFGTGYIWRQYNFALGYSFNNTNAALVMTAKEPVYMIAEQTSNGMAKLKTPFFTQTLPNTADGLLYILLGYATSEVNLELTLDHPIYEYRDGGIKLYRDTYTKNETDTLLNGKASSTHTHTTSNIIDFPTIPSKTSDLTNDSGFLTSHQDISGKENTSNKVISLSSSSTDTQYPSAKIVYDSLNDLHTSDIKIGSEPLTNIWTGATITEQAALNTLLNNHIGEIDARLQKEEIVYGSIYKTESSKVYISGTYNKVCESVNSQHPLSNEMILFKLPNDLNSSSTKSIKIKVIYYVNSYSSSPSYYELGVKYNNATVNENTFASNTIILLKLNNNNNGFDVVGVFSPNSTGSYNDLTNKPSIPSKTSDLTNDSGFLTSHQSLANYVQKSSTTGLLQNDGTVNTTIIQNVNDIGQTLSSLSDVASSGDYDDLTNKPSYTPTVTSNTSGAYEIGTINISGTDVTIYGKDTDTHQSLTNYVQKNNTVGLLKNDGTVMTGGNGASNFAVGNHTHSNYLTSHQDISGKEDTSNKAPVLSDSDTAYPSSSAVYNEFNYERRDKSKDLIIKTQEYSSAHTFHLNENRNPSFEPNGDEEYIINWGDRKDTFENGLEVYRSYPTSDESHTITISPITTPILMIGRDCFYDTDMKISSITIPSTVEVLYEGCFDNQIFDEITIDLDTLWNTVMNEALPVYIETDVIKFYASTFDSQRWEQVKNYNQNTFGGDITINRETLLIDDKNIINESLTNDYPYYPISSQGVQDGLDTKVDKSIKITANTDLDTLTSVGFYSCSSNQTVATLSNCPTVYGFTLSVELNGAYGNGVKQVLTEYISTNTWIRVFYTDGNTLVTTGWKRIYTEEDLDWKTASLTNMSGCTLYYNEMFCALKINKSGVSVGTVNTYANLVSGTIPSDYRPAVPVAMRNDGAINVYFKVTTNGEVQMISDYKPSSSFTGKTIIIWARI